MPLLSESGYSSSWAMKSKYSSGINVILSMWFVHQNIFPSRVNISWMQKHVCGGLLYKKVKQVLAGLYWSLYIDEHL
jgi:hypothetical protein